MASLATAGPALRAPTYDPSASPVTSVELDRDRQVHLQHFRGSSADVEHPPLRHNILSMHLGGPKRITRTAGRRRNERVVQVGALTILPARHAYRWRTEGPVEFAHLILPAGILHQVAWEEFDRAPAALALHEALGFRSPFIEHALTGLLADLARDRPGRLYRDGLMTALTYTLLRDHSNIGGHRAHTVSQQRRGGLAVHVLARVVGYMHAHLLHDIAPAELIALTGLSRAQFYRGFKQSTGLSPGAYLAALRRSSAARARDAGAGRDADTPSRHAPG